MFSLNSKREQMLKKKKRRIVFDALPRDWSVRKKVGVASLVEDASDNAWKDYPSGKTGQLALKAIKSLNDRQTEFHNVFAVLYDLMEDNHRISESIIAASKETGISLEQVELAIETLKMAAQLPENQSSLPKGSGNPPTERGRHDLAVAGVLIRCGISTNNAAKILAKIRKEDPWAGVYEGNPKVVTDLSKEEKAIYYRLEREFGNVPTAPKKEIKITCDRTKKDL